MPSTKSPTEICPVCVGDGQIEYEIERRQTFGRDIGYLDTEWDDCYACEGTGEVPIPDYLLTSKE